MSSKTDAPPAYPAHEDAGPYIQSPPPAASSDNRMMQHNDNQQAWTQQQHPYGSPSPGPQQQYGFYGPTGGNPNYNGNGPYNNQYQYNQGGQQGGYPGGYGAPPPGMYYQYQQGPPPGGYYHDDRRGGTGTDVCAGLFGALACCCCLDALFWI